MSESIITNTEFLKHKELFNSKATTSDHTHHCYELSYFVDGGGTLDINGSKHSFSKGTFTVTKPYIHHSQISEYVDVIYIGFYYNDSFGALKSGVFNDEDGSFLGILKKMESEFAELKNNYSLLLTEYQKLLIIFLLRKQYANPKGGNTESTLQYAASYIQENYYTNIDVEQLANSLGYSYHRFRHLFKQEFGATINQYIVNQRLTYAMQQLRGTKKTVKKIAAECGFGNQANLISNFKSVLNCTPSQYRNSPDSNMETYNYHK